jgi:hypothetical protein
MRITKQLPSLSNVAASSKATLNCPVGLTYDQVTFEYSGITAAQLTNLQVDINGKTVQYFASATDVVLLNDYYGRPKTAGFLTLHFNRPEMDYEQGMNRLTGLGTSDVQTLQISMDCAAATTPVIAAHAVLSDPQPLGLITKIKRFQVSASAIGQFEIDNIPRAGRICALHLMNDGITDVEVELDSRKVTDASKTLIGALQTENGRTPQTAAMTSIDYCLEGDIKQAMTMQGVQDFRIRPTIDAAEAVPIYVEYLDGFAGI